MEQVDQPDPNEDLERRFQIAARQPMNRRQRRALLQEAKRRGFDTRGRKALVKVPLDLGVKTFKHLGPKHLQREYKDYAWKQHREATEPVLDKDKVQNSRRSRKSTKSQTSKDKS